MNSYVATLNKSEKVSVAKDFLRYNREYKKCLIVGLCLFSSVSVQWLRRRNNTLDFKFLKKVSS